MSLVGGWRFKWLLGLLIGAGLLGGLILAVESRASRETVAEQNQRRIAALGIDLDAPRYGQPYPKAIAEDREFDFGELDVGQTGRHEFVVRNVGDGRLHFERGTTSCHCTSMELEKTSIGPGEEGRITLEWHTTRPTEKFVHGGWIITDDPALRKIRFTVSGTVRARLSAAPSEATFAGVTRDEKAVAKVTLHSQAWDDLEVIKVESDAGKIAWRIESASPAVLTELKAKWARELTIEAGPDLPLGPYQSVVRVYARPTGDPDAATIVREVPFQGQVVRDISLAAPGYSRGVLDLGMIAKGRLVTGKLHAIVRGDHQDLAIGEIVVDPAFLHVRMTRDGHVSGKAAHYVIDIEIPADAPLADYLGGERLGEVRIPVDHPEMSEIRFDLRFAIVPDLRIARPTTATFEKAAEPQP